MSRRNGQNPKVRVGKRANGQKYFFFQYWVDVPGQEERQRRTEVVGLVGEQTRSEAERKKLDFIIQKLELNSSDYQIPCSLTFADAVKHYREKFAPRMLRDSTLSTAETHLKAHLETDWNTIPVEHITIDSINEWAWKKRDEGLSWVTVKNILRTMQRVLSCSTRDGKPPFSQAGLTIPERDRVQMRIENRRRVSFSWPQAKKIVEHVGTMATLGSGRRDQYAALFLLAAASGLRCSELFALKFNDVDFQARTIRVDESSDQRTKGRLGDPKNAAAFRPVLLADAEGREALRVLRAFIGTESDPNALIFRSKKGGPLRENCVLTQGLHPALKALGFEKDGMHAFRRGCNRRWELAGMNPAVLRQQMGHSSSAMTARYTGEIPVEQVRAGFSMKFGNENVVLENMENEAAA
jgi:integrase